MKTFSFKDVYYVCKINIHDLETKKNCGPTLYKK